MYYLRVDGDHPGVGLVPLTVTIVALIITTVETIGTEIFYGLFPLTQYLPVTLGFRCRTSCPSIAEIEHNPFKDDIFKIKENALYLQGILNKLFMNLNKS